MKKPNLNRKLLTAVQKDDAVTVKALIAKGVDVDARIDQGATALMVAANCDAGRAAKVLIAAGSSLDLRLGSDGPTALHLACRRAKMAVATALVEAGADVNARLKRSRQMPLHIASGNPKLVRRLLAAGARVDAVDDRGSTPLMLAAFYLSEESVRVLLEAGADATLKDMSGQSALDILREQAAGGEPTAKALDLFVSTLGPPSVKRQVAAAQSRRSDRARELVRLVIEKQGKTSNG